MNRPRLGLVGASLFIASCTREPLDLLVRGESADPCAAFTSQEACSEQATLGCSFQPNAEGCQSSDPQCAPGMCRRSDPFVRSVERRFFLNGAPFRFIGVSSWAMLQPDPCASIPKRDREDWVEGIYDALVPAHVKVARLLAPQSSAGASGSDFTLLDAAVRGARRAGIRLQLVLEAGGDGGCSSGVQHDAAWYAGGYQAPEGPYPLSYREYAAAVATHYRNEPTVLGYLPVQGFGGAEPAVLTSFIADIGQLLRDKAPSQLLSIDLEWPGAGDGADLYRELQSLPLVSFVDVDDYTFNYPAQPLDPGLIRLLAEINKPAVVGEGAFALQGNDEQALSSRAAAVEARMREWKTWGFSGALLWAYDPGWTEVSEEFDARPSDPILQAGGVLEGAPF